VHLVEIELIDVVIEQYRFLACAFCQFDISVEITITLFSCHNYIPSFLKYPHEDLCHEIADESASRECQDPGPYHFLDDAPIDCADPLGCRHTHDRGVFGMCRRNGNTGQGSDQQTAGRSDICGKTLILFQSDHVHSNSLDDLIAADRST